MNENLQERSEHEKRLDHHIHQLMEHYDSVQIFVTRNEPRADGTKFLSRGDGNMFTRLGQIEHWIVACHERTRIQTRIEEHHNRKDEDPA